jgi:hypothetical protein
MTAAMSDLTECHGEVVDTASAPVPGARIAIVASSVPMPEIALVSDADGSFSLRLPAGRFTLRAHGPGGTSGEVEVEGAPASGRIVIVVGQ